MSGGDIPEKKMLGNCEHCRGVILKELDCSEMEGSATMRMRCPHCHKDVNVHISVDKCASVVVSKHE